MKGQQKVRVMMRRGGGILQEHMYNMIQQSNLMDDESTQTTGTWSRLILLFSVNLHYHNATFNKYGNVFCFHFIQLCNANFKRYGHALFYFSVSYMVAT